MALTSPSFSHLILTLVVSILFPVSAQAQPAQNGSMLPVAIWWIASCVLGLVLAYGIIHTRGRSRAEKRQTEQATKKLYAEEENDRIKSGSV